MITFEEINLKKDAKLLNLQLLHTLTFKPMLYYLRQIDNKNNRCRLDSGQYSVNSYGLGEAELIIEKMGGCEYPYSNKKISNILFYLYRVQLYDFFH